MKLKSLIELILILLDAERPLKSIFNLTNLKEYLDQEYYYKQKFSQDMPLGFICNKTLVECDLSLLDLRDTVIYNSKLIDCSLEGVALSDSLIINSNFEGSSLLGSYIDNVNFINCRLDGANLEEVKAANTDFSSASISGVIFKNAYMPSSKWIPENLKFKFSGIPIHSYTDLYLKLYRIISSYVNKDEEKLFSSNLNLDKCFNSGFITLTKDNAIPLKEALGSRRAIEVIQANNCNMPLNFIQKPKSFIKDLESLVYKEITNYSPITQDKKVDVLVEKEDLRSQLNL